MKIKNQNIYVFPQIYPVIFVVLLHNSFVSNQYTHFELNMEFKSCDILSKSKKFFLFCENLLSYQIYLFCNKLFYYLVTFLNMTFEI